MTFIEFLQMHQTGLLATVLVSSAISIIYANTGDK